MKGIIMAGGSGTRLYPSSFAFSKHLLPIFDKPLIYYPLSILMLADVKEILLIVNPNDLAIFKKLLANGKDLGIKIKYKVQKKPRGIADVFHLSKNFIKKDNFFLILGDNFFWGDGLYDKLMIAKNTRKKNVLFTYKVDNPKDFAVLHHNKKNKLIVEKPKKTKSNSIITGLYFYKNDVCEVAKSLKPSLRGELEITDVNNYFLKKNTTEIIDLGRGFAWFDCGTNKNLNESSSFVQTIEKRQGYKIACLEEIAYLKKWISKEKIKKIAKKYHYNDYANYLLKIIK